MALCPSADNLNGPDGTDYIEGGGGHDVIFGNQGQDDLIGGSSDMFTLLTPAQRPDGTDLIFGGSGTGVARNAPGDTTGTGHASDSDAIAGDNADIVRLVAVNGGTAPTGFLSFGYDNYSLAGLKIVPRAIVLLDYTAGGLDFNLAAAANDIGAADEIHGENGDDFVYGMRGNDVLYGDAQNDTIVGGYGADWISGGTGDDGILGDDGRLFSSRVGTAEPLYGLAADPANTQNLSISTPGNIQEAIINVTGSLRYTADLTPNNLVPGNPAPNTTTPRPLFANDVIYGGLGHDSIHGGAGEDAISGAEAPGTGYANVYDLAGTQQNAAPVQTDFSHPFNPGNLLGYDPATTKFAQYDANDPLRAVLLTPTGALWKGTGPSFNWFLNFDYSEGPTDTFWASGTSYPGVSTDGDDVAFGDLGHDWLVGGTGRDQLFGGWHDDLMMVDDKLTTNSSLTTVPDTNPSYEDLAYGGAGRDVMIGNTGGDRLIDWVGEFNTYLVPFAPFGEPTISTQLGPGMPEFLYALAKSSGADQTLAAQYGGAAARSGEPFGELALVIRQDPMWDDQRGEPRDPQAGNIPGGPRDVLRTAGNKVLRSPATTVNLAPSALTSAAAAPAADVATLTSAQLEAAASEAKAEWSIAAPGADLSGVSFAIADLPDLLLAVAAGSEIIVDATAAGWGWSVSYPGEEVVRMDLRSVVLHELGHVLGLEHADEGVMSESLAAGDTREMRASEQRVAASEAWYVIGREDFEHSFAVTVRDRAIGVADLEGLLLGMRAPQLPRIGAARGNTLSIRWSAPARFWRVPSRWRSLAR
jgi:Ca2+-binding RTX toxin-like protein